MLGLPFDDQRRLIDAAEDRGWNRKQLEDRAARLRKELGGPAGRPPLPRVQKTIRSFRRLVADPEVAFGDLDALHDMEPEDATELYQTVFALRVHPRSVKNRYTTPSVRMATRASTTEK